MDQFQKEEDSSELFSGAISSTRISCLWSYAWMLRMFIFLHVSKAAVLLWSLLIACSSLFWDNTGMCLCSFYYIYSLVSKGGQWVSEWWPTSC